MASKVKPLSRPLVEVWLMVYSAQSFTLLGFLVLFVIQKPAFSQSKVDSSARDFSIQLTTMREGYDGKFCWVHARTGMIPTRRDSDPIMVMTSQKLQLSGSDVFYALHTAYSSNAGIVWSPLTPQDPFTRRKVGKDQEETVCDFTPQWHEATQKLLGIGQTVRYQDNRVMHIRPRATAYSVYDPETHSWDAWQTLKMPNEPRFKSSGAGSVQRWDLKNGEVLLPIYFKEPEATQYSVTVCRCEFDGKQLRYLEHGDELTIDNKRGLYEPSLVKHQDRFFLTLRNDDACYVATSEDGLHFTQPQPWCFDDGTRLGNYNTQQHWISNNHGLYLIYTRKGADNDHVFRHRAPLFIARVDPERRVVERATEKILVPERGARLGNFGVTRVSPDEFWITVTEWMQTWGPDIIIPPDNPRGANNRIYIAKLKWSQP